MAASIVQSILGSTAASGVSSQGYTLGSSVTAGNSLAVLVTKTLTDARTFQCSDSLNGSWTNFSGQTTSYNSAAGYFLNSAGGACTVTVSLVSGTSTWAASIYETNCDALDQAINLEARASNATSHPAWDPAVDFSADAIGFVAGIHNASATPSAATDWTGDYVASAAIHMSRVFTTADTGESATWSSSTSRNYKSTAFALKKTAGAAANPKGIFGLPLDGPFRRAVY